MNDILREIIFFILLFVQFKNGQIVSVGLVGVLSIIVLFYCLGKNEKVRQWSIDMLLLWISLLLSVIRFKYISDIETQIELFWLLFGGVCIFISSVRVYISRQIIYTIYDSAFWGSVLVVISVIMNTTLGGLMNYPYGGTRVMGGFDGPNECGAFYLMALTLMLSYNYLNKPEGRDKFVLLKAISMSVPIVLSWSRSVYVAFIIMIIVLSYELIHGSNSKIKTGIRMIVVMGVLLIPLIIYIYPIFMKVRLNAGNRDYIVENAMKILGDNLVFGSGLGSYWFLSGGDNATPHSEYLLFLVSGGLISISILLLFFARLLLRNVHQGRIEIVCALIVFFVLEGAFNNLIRGRLGILFWIIMIAANYVDHKYDGHLVTPNA